jgi:hypothetical protein
MLRLTVCSLIVFAAACGSSPQLPAFDTARVARDSAQALRLACEVLDGKPDVPADVAETCAQLRSVERGACADAAAGAGGAP